MTPFPADLPVMEQVEIGDVAIAYDDPYSSRTFLLVMRNALLIPSMDHNLLPPFLVREASLFLDETPKFQSTDLTRNNHTIFDEETRMRIHLHLPGKGGTTNTVLGQPSKPKVSNSTNFRERVHRRCGFQPGKTPERRQRTLQGIHTSVNPIFDLAKFI